MKPIKCQSSKEICLYLLKNKETSGNFIIIVLVRISLNCHELISGIRNAWLGREELRELGENLELRHETNAKSYQTIQKRQEPFLTSKREQTVTLALQAFFLQVK